MLIRGLISPMMLVGIFAAAATPAPPASDLPPLVWELVGYTVTNGEPVEIADPFRYTLQFLPEGRLAARLDCNQGGGRFAVADGVLTVTPLASTDMACPPDSEAHVFASLLRVATAYRFDPEEGSLLLRGDAGVLKLQPTLPGVTWQWQGNTSNDGQITRQPDHPEKYTLTFLPEGMLAIQADCNRARGAYTVTGSSIDLHVGGVTRMICPPGSLMQPFLDDLDAAISYSIQQGNLALALPAGGGIMSFAPVIVTPAEGAPATPATG